MKRNSTKRPIAFSLAAILTFSVLTSDSRKTDGGSSRRLASTELTYESLIQLITDKGVQSIDDLLPLLPESFLSNYATVYRTHGIQETSDLSQTAPMYPRILMYNGEDTNYTSPYHHKGDTRLVLSFNGSPKQKGYDELEVMQYRADTQEFEFREIHFPYDPKNPPEKNPKQRCLRCHGDDPKPNWDSYFLWPGTLGAHDDDAIGRDIERAKQIPRNEGRYRFLKTVARAPNDFLSAGLSELNAHRLMRKISKSAVLNPYRYAIIGAALCLDGRYPLNRFIPNDTLQSFLGDYGSTLIDTVQKNRAYFNERVRQIRADLTTRDGNDPLAEKRAERKEYKQQAPEYSEAIARVRFIVEGLGASMTDWDLPFEQNTYSFNDGRLGIINPEWWLDLLVGEEDEAFVKSRSEKLVGYFYSLDSKHPQPMPSEYSDVCERLSERSLASIGQLPLKPARPKASNQTSATLPLCISCHVGTDAPGPIIPFADRARMKKWLNESDGTGQKNLDLLLDRISDDPQTGQRMPPFRPLVPYEKKELELYLNHL